MFVTSIEFLLSIVCKKINLFCTYYSLCRDILLCFIDKFACWAPWASCQKALTKEKTQRKEIIGMYVL